MDKEKLKDALGNIELEIKKLNEVVKSMQDAPAEFQAMFLMGSGFAHGTMVLALENLVSKTSSYEETIGIASAISVLRALIKDFSEQIKTWKHVRESGQAQSEPTGGTLK